MGGEALRLVGIISSHLIFKCACILIGNAASKASCWRLMCKYFCLVKSLQFFEIRRRVEEVPTVANVQNTVALRQVLMSNHCVSSHALLRYCVLLLDDAQFHVKRRDCVPATENNGGISINPTRRLRAIQTPKAPELFRLRAHPWFLMRCPNVLPARRVGEHAKISAEPSL